MQARSRHGSRLAVLLVVAVIATAMPFTGLPHLAAAGPTQIFINEIHYDNDGTDAGEAIELAGPAGTDLTGWSLVLYNGNGGVVYNTTMLSGVIPDQQAGFGTLYFTYPVNGIQNGSPDGVALVDAGGNAIQFLSYEGSFTAVGGAADGLTSTDIGVTEPGDTPVGHSLQLAGAGMVYEDFSWAVPAPSTFGAVNAAQTFGEPVRQVKINEFSVSTVGTDVEYIELYGQPATDYSAYTLIEIEGDVGGTGVIDEVISIGTTDADGFYLDNLPANTLENGSITLLLVDNFVGAFGTDLDADDDGLFDTSPWDAIVDAVAVNDGGSGDITYGVPELTIAYDGLPYAPGGASRIPDGWDTESATDWVRNDFDLAGIEGYPGSITLGEAYNTPGESNRVYILPPEACGDPYTPVYEIQGNGMASPLAGTEVAVEGIVVGDFQNNLMPDDGDLNGFYIQDPTGDGDATTSDGVYIYAPTGIDVSVGDRVRVRGTVSEYYDLTEVGSVSRIWWCATGATIPATPLSLPVTAIDDFEPYEGMLVTFAQPLTISEYYNFDRYGEIVLTTARQNQPTAIFDPGTPEAAALTLANTLSRITLDDGQGSQNPDPARHPNGSIFDLTNLFRGGDAVANVTGVVDYNYGVYKIQPTAGADYIPLNPRPAQPDAVGGNVTVAGVNVLNYFTTIDTGDWICGPSQDQECRGADTPEELTRQRDKIIAALATMDADVVGLIEIENHPGDIPTADLVAGLNDALGAGTYAYIATGAIGTDAIRVALIYKSDTVTPLGGYAILDSSVDARFRDDYNRPVLAQSFMDTTDGGIFTVAVNHLKSKGSSCADIGDPDLGDGASNCNLTRTTAAEALVDWLATDPTGSGDADFLIIGDLNSYDKEDPIDTILDGDYTDLIRQYMGEEAYSYVFDGQVGYLDHALANASLLPEVTGTTVWHINADEPDLIDYDTTYKQDAQDALYEPNAFRASDHDPVLVGMAVCDEIAPTLEVSVSHDTLWPANHRYVKVRATVTTGDNFDAHPTVTLVSVTSSEADNGLGDGDTENDIVILNDFLFKLRAERSGTNGEGRTYTITYQVTDACGNTTVESATVFVPFSRR